MAFRITSYLVDPGDKQIKMAHVFYGQTEKEAWDYYEEHLSHCHYFQEAGEAGRINEVEEIPDDELPQPEDFDEEEEDE